MLLPTTDSNYTITSEHRIWTISRKSLGVYANSATAHIHEGNFRKNSHQLNTVSNHGLRDVLSERHGRFLPAIGCVLTMTLRDDSFVCVISRKYFFLNGMVFLEIP